METKAYFCGKMGMSLFKSPTSVESRIKSSKLPERGENGRSGTLANLSSGLSAETKENYYELKPSNAESLLELPAVQLTNVYFSRGIQVLRII